MKVLKFGGKSLSNGSPLDRVLSIISKEHQQSELSVVVSARGNSTDLLLGMYHKAIEGEQFEDVLERFFEMQNEVLYDEQIIAYRLELARLLNSIRLLKVENVHLECRVLAFGELLSAYTVSKLLKDVGKKTVLVDAREWFVLKENGEINLPRSSSLVRNFYNGLNRGEIPIVTGFIAINEEGEPVTLGRNGSNYSATILANLIDAEEVQNWTNVDGIYSANPKFVRQASLISELSYKEANELANFGTHILHSKTILPLIEKEIPLIIKNSFIPEGKGTRITKSGGAKGIKAVSVIEDVALITIEGRGLIGEVGIDARIFTALSKKGISVRLIAQASSERGIGFVVDKENGQKAWELLLKEFEIERKQDLISSIQFHIDKAIIAILGRHNFALEKAIGGLRRNKIWMHLISNSISGEHISLVVDNNQLKKAVNVVHNHVFGALKTLNLVTIGKGTVGGKLLDQITQTTAEVVKQRGLKINVVGAVDSQRFFIDENGIGRDWRKQLNSSKKVLNYDTLLEELEKTGLENIVIADNTSSENVTTLYPEFLKRGYDIVASNKKGNSASYQFYQELRDVLRRKGRQFYYETNVGAGLPLIDTLKNLRHSSDKVQKIVGVFSGSLSYIFNHFSQGDKPFSEVLSKAVELGLTEPDPREDLGGQDVARKLIILAREIGLKSEFEEVEIENLLPSELRDIQNYDAFLVESQKLDEHYQVLKESLQPNEVLRYVGELDVAANRLSVNLMKADRQSPLGNIKNSDSIFEIYTEGYGTQPIIIQGAGAGAEVTARGVYSDLLRLGKGY